MFKKFIFLFLFTVVSYSQNSIENVFLIDTEKKIDSLNSCLSSIGNSVEINRVQFRIDTLKQYKQELLLKIVDNNMYYNKLYINNLGIFHQFCGTIILISGVSSFAGGLLFGEKLGAPLSISMVLGGIGVCCFGGWEISIGSNLKRYK